MTPVKVNSHHHFLLPALLFLMSVTVTFLLWRVMYITGQERIQLETQVTAEQVKFRLEAWFDSRAAVLTLLGEEWGQATNPSPAEFSTRAGRIIQLYPGFQALNFIDEEWRIRYVVPVASNQAALGKDLHHHPDPGVREAIALARDDGVIHRTPLIQLLQGEPGFASYVPVLDSSEHVVGYINGVFGVDELVNSCLSEPRLRERFRFRLMTPDGREAYDSAETGEVFPSDRAVVVSVRIVDRNWRLETALSSAGMVTADTRADELMAAVGVALSLLLSGLLWAYQKRQAELAERREEFRLLVENQEDFMVRITPEGRIDYASPSFCRLVGRGEDQVQGLTIQEMVTPGDLDNFNRSLAAMQAPPYRQEGEFRISTPRGDVWTGWTGTGFFGRDEKLDGYLGVGRDISRRRDLENQLRQSQRLQAVGQLAGGIAHDFNNILQAIQGYLELVMNEPDLDLQIHDDLEQASLAADRAAVLVRQLLAFSRRQILMPVNLDLNQVFADLKPMLERVLGSAIPIEFVPGPELGLVKADQGQIEQIFMNLAVNARDAIDGGGRITVRTSNETVDQEFCQQHQGQSPGQYVRVDLSDTGSGMSPEVMDKLFEPFFTTKETGAGTGLGLATVYGIVKQHDGMILVESEPGRGSCFSVYLPRSRGELPDQDIPPAALASPGRETVLFAEDERMLRKLGTRIMEGAGYKVISCHDGQDAWDRFLQDEKAIDLAVLDVVMPNLGGRELAESLRRQRPDLPVLFVSGYDSDSASGRRQPLPNSALVAKPYNRNDLLAAMRNILE
jgi:PAS domain S-box-containing protein